MTPNHPAGKQVLTWLSYTLKNSLTFSTAFWHHKSMMLHCEKTSKYFTLLCFFTTVDEGTCTTHWHKNFNKESFVSKSHRTLVPNLQRKTDFCNVTTKACSCMWVPNTLQFHSNSTLITIRFEVINSGCCSNGMASNKFLLTFRNNLPICSGWLNQVQVVVEHPAEPDYPTQCNTIIRKQNRVQLLAQAEFLVAPPRPEHLKGQPTQPVTWWSFFHQTSRSERETNIFATSNAALENLFSFVGKKTCITWTWHELNINVWTTMSAHITTFGYRGCWDDDVRTSSSGRSKNFSWSRSRDSVLKNPFLKTNIFNTSLFNIILRIWQISRMKKNE